jgi:drug/metabolite transporter (DMT)-like permease
LLVLEDHRSDTASMPQPGYARAWGALALTIVLWASAFPAIREALRSFTAGELCALRLALASVVLLAVAPLIGLRAPARRDLPRMAIAGLIGMAAYQLLLSAGERTITAGTASILVNTAPVFVALLAIRFLGERLTTRAWFGVSLGFAGAFVIAVGSGTSASVSAGALLVLGAAIAQASFFVIQKPLLRRYTPFEVTTYAIIVGAVMLLPFAGSVPRAVADASPEALAAVLFLALGPSALGLFAWAFAIARLNVSRAASALYTVPVVAILIGWIWLDELPSAAAVAGGVVAICGVMLTNISRARRPSRAGI